MFSTEKSGGKKKQNLLYDLFTKYLTLVDYTFSKAICSIRLNGFSMFFALFEYGNYFSSYFFFLFALSFAWIYVNWWICIDRLYILTRQWNALTVFFIHIFPKQNSSKSPIIHQIFTVIFIRQRTKNHLWLSSPQHFFYVQKKKKKKRREKKMLPAFSYNGNWRNKK